MQDDYEDEGCEITSSSLSDLQSLSTQGHTGDALAFVGDEGRDKLRKAPVRRTWPFDPEISEWENPAGFILEYLLSEYIG